MLKKLNGDDKTSHVHLLQRLQHLHPGLHLRRVVVQRKRDNRVALFARGKVDFRNVVDAAVVDAAEVGRERAARTDVQLRPVLQVLTFFDDVLALFPNGLVPPDHKVGIKLAQVEDRPEVHVPVGSLHDVSETGRVPHELVVSGEPQRLAELPGEVTRHVRQHVQSLVGTLSKMV